MYIKWSIPIYLILIDLMWEIVLWKPSPHNRQPHRVIFVRLSLHISKMCPATYNNNLVMYKKYRSIYLINYFNKPNRIYKYTKLLYLIKSKVSPKRIIVAISVNDDVWTKCVLQHPPLFEEAKQFKIIILESLKLKMCQTMLHMAWPRMCGMVSSELTMNSVVQIHQIRWITTRSRGTGSGELDANQIWQLKIVNYRP